MSVCVCLIDFVCRTFLMDTIILFFLYTFSGIRNITSSVQELLGENTILVVASDNGAVPWFGGTL